MSLKRPGLFDRVKIGNIELKNRIVMAPAANLFGEEFVNDRVVDFYVERARGGVGLIIASPFIVDPAGRTGWWALGIWDDKHLEGLSRLAREVHQHGARIAIQIAHGGKYASSSVTGVQPVSPSAVFSNRTREMPRELTVPEIQHLVGTFAEAVRRARDAGFDAVEFNSYSGYLIREFLSPLTNKRSDEYGGDVKKRMRFYLEIIEESQKRAGKDFPLLCKISADEFLPGGNTLKETRVIARELEKAGVGAIDVGAGGHETTVPLTTGNVPSGAFTYLSQGIKEEVSVPVITSYLGDPFLAEQVVAEGKADLVAFARALFADPDLPHKLEEGRVEDVRRCIRCLQGCYDMMLTDQPTKCTVNASMGREREFELKPAAQKKSVMVVGGGPAGMEAARVLSLRGHQVMLYEKEERLGGQLNIGSVPPGKAEFRYLISYLERQLDKLDVRVILGQEVSAELVAREKPQAVVVATGAVPIIPAMPGVERENVVTAFDILSGKVVAGDRVVVVGAGGIGCETALFLAQQGAMDIESAFFLLNWEAIDLDSAIALARKGKRKVTILEMDKSIGKDLGIVRKGLIRRFFRDLGVEVLTGARVVKITEEGVVFSREDATETIAADTVVLAVGTRPLNVVYPSLRGLVPELFEIGDCKEPRKAMDAIYEGSLVGREI